jgi:hypothetical protein
MLFAFCYFFRRSTHQVAKNHHFGAAAAAKNEWRGEQGGGERE